MLLISFPLEMTTWVAPASLVRHRHPLAGKSAHHLHESADRRHGERIAARSREDRVHARRRPRSGAGGLLRTDEYAVGSRAGSLGETAAVLLLIGGLFLIARRIITWHAPFAMLLGVALPALLFNAFDGNHYAGPMYHLLTGGLMLGAFFIVTDPVTSPNTALGQFIFVSVADCSPGSSVLGRLSGGGGIRGDDHEHRCADHRPVRQTAHLRARPQGRSAAVKKEA